MSVSKSDSPLEELLESYSFTGVQSTFVLKDLAIKPWTSETPNLYNVFIELFDEEGNEIPQTKKASKVVYES